MLPSASRDTNMCVLSALGTLPVRELDSLAGDAVSSSGTQPQDSSLLLLMTSSSFSPLSVSLFPPLSFMNCSSWSICSETATEASDSLSPDWCPSRWAWGPVELASRSMVGKGSLGWMFSLSSRFGWRIAEMWVGEAHMQALFLGRDWKGEQLRIGEQPSTNGLSPHRFMFMSELPIGMPLGDKNDSLLLSPIKTKFCVTSHTLKVQVGVCELVKS